MERTSDEIARTTPFLGDKLTHLKEFRRLVSVCASKDLGVWRVASRHILSFVSASEYCLVCPDAEVSLFRSQTPKAWRIRGDSEFAEGWDASKISEFLGSSRAEASWLLQQFLKLHAISDAELDAGDNVLVWDADTVPLRRLRFTTNRSDSFKIYYGTEYYRPYFDTISKLLAIDKHLPESFIAQCFPAKVRWVRELLAAIAGPKEGCHVTIILQSLRSSGNAHAFSEYETMGTWILARYPHGIVRNPRNRWSREGARVLGTDLSSGRARFILFLLSFYFDFVAFERWQAKESISKLFMKRARRMVARRLGQW